MNSIRSLFKKPESRALLLFCAGLLLFIVLYLPILPNPFFTIDDRELIKIPQLTNPVGFNSLATIFRVGSHIDYYPVRDLSYLIDIHVFGGSPTAFRLHQMFLIVASVIALACIFLEFGIPLIYSVLGSWLWILFPLHVEMITWISSRKDVLAILYALLSVLFFLKKKYKTSAVLFFVSLLSKASFLFLPFFALFWIFFQKPKNKTWIPVSALCGLAFLYGFFQKWIYSVINKMDLKLPFEERLQLSLTALGKMVAGWIYWPVNIVDVENLGSWLQINKGFIYIGVLVWLIYFLSLAYAIIKQNLTPALGAVGALVLYAPVSGLFFPHRNFYSVRYLEPLFLFLFILLFCISFQKWKNRRYFNLGLGGVFVFCILGTFNEVQNWNSNLSVRYKAFEESPQSLSLRAQLLADLLNEQRDRGPHMAEKDKLQLKTQKEFLESACKAPMHDEDCWRFQDMKYQLGRANTKEFLDSLYTHQRYLSWSRYSVDWALKTNKNLRDSLEVFSKYYKWHPTPQLRFERLTALCFLSGTQEAKDYYNELKDQNLFDEKDFKSRFSEISESNQKKLLSCLP